MWSLTAVLVGVVTSQVGGGRRDPPGPTYPPTEGRVWPTPRTEKKQRLYYSFSPDLFTIEVVGVSCPILVSAISRCVDVLSGGTGYSEHTGHAGRRGTGHRGTGRRVLVTPGSHSEDHGGLLQSLRVNLTQPCELNPHAMMDESYNLKVSATSTLTAKSVWGALHGLETFLQLIYTNHHKEVFINASTISDWPRYRHRGVLIDSARHFLPVTVVTRILHAMAINKMNVLHWHLTDDQSFPYHSDVFPELSGRGAFHPSLVYKSGDIARVVEFARERGIRVIPEIDVPGHVKSWGLSRPSLLTQCSGDKDFRGPLDVSSDEVYAVLEGLLGEVTSHFPETMLHLGGDEVDDICWGANQDVMKYMAQTPAARPSELQGVFLRRVRALLPPSVQLIVWEDVFHQTAQGSSKVPQNVTIQLWKTGRSERIEPILRAGHDVIMSTGWYLDHMDQTVADMYRRDPRRIANVPHLAHKVVGGEACMWGERVDEHNIISRMFPRASAVAEVLWSSEQEWEPSDGDTSVAQRLEEHVCRMTRRGVAVGPIGAGYCVRD